MIIHLPYLLFAVFLAYDNANRIEGGKKIRHWLNGLFHLVAAGIMTLVSWQDGVTLLLLTKTVFDSALSVFRGLNVFYSSPDPNKAWTDRLEEKVFRKPVIARIVYLIIVICLQISK